MPFTLDHAQHASCVVASEFLICDGHVAQAPARLWMQMASTHTHDQRASKEAME